MSARSDEQPSPKTSGERESPRWRHIVLLVLFAVLAVVGVFTVLIPEIEDDNPEGSATDEPASAEASE